VQAEVLVDAVPITHCFHCTKGLDKKKYLKEDNKDGTRDT